MQLIYGIIITILFALTASAEETRLAISLNQFGEVQIGESSNPGDTVDSSLANIAYGMGAMQWWLDPITTMIGTIHVTDLGPELNQEALNEFLRTEDPQYTAITKGLLNNFREVDDDGTIERRISGQATLEQSQNLLRRLGVKQAAEAEFANFTPENRQIVERWLKGAQDTAARSEAEFYSRHPALRATNIVAYFKNISLVNIIENYIWSGLGYDYATSGALLDVSPDWVQNFSIGRSIGAPNIAPITYNPNLSNLRGRSGADLAIGASNGGAFSYVPVEEPNTRRCVVTGEPHQPSTYDFWGGAFQQMKIFKAYVRVGGGKVQPLFTAAYPSLPAFAGIHATEFSATSGTAGPTGSSLMFVAPTDGTRYFYNRSWSNFDAKTISILKDGAQYPITVYEIPGFGEVFATVRDPSSGQHYVLTIRTKPHASFLQGFWNRIRAGLKNDGAGYISALESPLPHYGEAGCHPALATSSSRDTQRAYFALNQGNVDSIRDLDRATSISANPIDPGFLKLGTLPPTLCFGQLWAVSDNGAFKSGCPDNPVRPYYQDPGWETFRQNQFKTWTRHNVESGRPLTPEEIYSFATSTYSMNLARMMRAVSIAVEKFGEQLIPKRQEAKARQTAEYLKSYDGSVKDNIEQILIQYLFQEISKNIVPGTLQTPNGVRDYFLYTDKSEDDLSAALDLPTAQFLIQKFLLALEFIDQECQSRGVTSYRQAVTMEISGVQVASEFAGPGVDSRSTGQFLFKEDSNGQKTCALRLIHGSPLKFVSMDHSIRYLPFGPPVGLGTLEPGLYSLANQAWGDYWGRHNKMGTGIGGIDSYKEFSLRSFYGDLPRDTESVRSFDLSIPGSGPTPTPSPTPTPALTPSPSVSPTASPSPSATPSIPPTSSPTPRPPLKAPKVKLEGAQLVVSVRGFIPSANQVKFILKGPKNISKRGTFRKFYKNGTSKYSTVFFSLPKGKYTASWRLILGGLSIESSPFKSFEIK